MSRNFVDERNWNRSSLKREEARIQHSAPINTWLNCVESSAIFLFSFLHVDSSSFFAVIKIKTSISSSNDSFFNAPAQSLAFFGRTIHTAARMSKTHLDLGNSHSSQPEESG